MKRLVKTTGATYSTLATVAGCHPSMIGHLVTGERDNPPLAILTNLASYFGADFAWLATGKGAAPTLKHLRAMAARRGVTRRGRVVGKPAVEAA
jgi:transcriptional regulator with XRE-family HTH domain